MTLALIRGRKHQAGSPSEPTEPLLRAPAERGRLEILAELFQSTHVFIVGTLQDFLTLYSLVPFIWISCGGLGVLTAEGLYFSVRLSLAYVGPCP